MSGFDLNKNTFGLGTNYLNSTNNNAFNTMLNTAGFTPTNMNGNLNIGSPVLGNNLIGSGLKLTTPTTMLNSDPLNSFTQITDLGTGATSSLLNNNINKNNSLFSGSGFGWDTGLGIAGLALGVLSNILAFNQANKQLKLEREKFAENKALNHANYKAQARQFNNNLAAQYSGRGGYGKSSVINNQLAADYRKNKLNEDY